MNMKRIVIIVISLFVIGQLSAERTDIKERSENWLKPSSSSGNLRSGSGLIDEEIPTDTPTHGDPVGDVPLLTFALLAAGYAVVSYRKKRQHKTIRHS
jgi:hypothetical protein